MKVQIIFSVVVAVVLVALADADSHLAYSPYGMYGLGHIPFMGQAGMMGGGMMQGVGGGMMQGMGGGMMKGMGAAGFAKRIGFGGYMPYGGYGYFNPMMYRMAL